MMIIVGYLVIIIGTLAGFMIAGGQPILLLHVSEFVTIGGITAGLVLVASPMKVLKEVISKTMAALKGSASRKVDYLDMLKMLYEIFVLARRNGLIALEDHILEPKNSLILQKYPSFLNDHERLEFLCSGLKPLIDGRIKPEQLHGLLEQELATKEEEAEAPIKVLQLIGDSLPGVGIIAAVLGIINTMSAISEGPEAVGEKVSAALTGTFLGILGAYGFVNPLTARIHHNNAVEHLYSVAMMKGLVGYVGGMAPMMAVEIARRSLDPSVQPNGDELETILKSIGK